MGAVLQDTMTERVSLCWHPDRPAERLPATDVVIDRLVEIGLGTTPDNGVAVVVAKPNGQEMVVIIAGDRWCLDWFPVDYDAQGCVGSFHTVADHQDASDYIVTYYIQGHLSRQAMKTGHGDFRYNKDEQSIATKPSIWRFDLRRVYCSGWLNRDVRP